MKIAICIPYYGPVPYPFVRSLAGLLLYSARMKLLKGDTEITPEIEVLDSTSSILPNSRNILLNDAIAKGAEYILWIDTDHTFPADALGRLLGRQLPVVGVNFMVRGGDTPVAADGKGKVWPTAELARESPVQEVAMMGMGMVLMRTDILLLLKQKPPGEPENLWPLFAIKESEDGGRFVGEDVHFFRRLKAAGVKLYIDNELSLEAGHLTMTEQRFPT